MSTATPTSSSKVIVITGGTSGIGYQAALALAQCDEKHTIVVTGRSQASAESAVTLLKEASKNDKIHYALADLSLQSGVAALINDLLKRFPAIDELVNNAGNLSVGEKETTEDGVDKNFAVNVIAPLMLTRGLVPALKAASPTGKVQITSGGTPFDTLDVNDLEATKKPVGVPAYSHSKRVAEAMAIALSRELEEQGIVVNVVGGALPGATNMTTAMGFKDMPWFMKMMYPVVKLVFKDDNGASAKKCAAPVVWAALASSKELGTGKSYLAGPKEGKFKPEVANEDNQKVVMSYIASKLVKT